MIPLPISHMLPSGFDGLLPWSEVERYLRESLDMALGALVGANADEPGHVGRAQGRVDIYRELLELPAILQTRRRALSDRQADAA
jgi:hypothetical protein